MKLNELKIYSQNNFDKEIIERMCKDSEENLNKYIINVICDLLKNIPMEESFMFAAKKFINNSKEENIAKISTYVSLIPYVQLKLKDRNDGYIIASSLIEILISYIVGCVEETTFDNKLLEIKQILEISNVFYKELIHYFEQYKDVIVDSISKKL
ncbi:hypothetical protein [Romboutsia lituseburensis]|uniref:hypothetical protein n=1 Tax=Romboutsia lituseburensis TaxID=1537 RepID=UPI00215A28DF|nr:hypothetical protein [Romboutsia lituseburensis]MCR8744084.1 hypothetical protein [Romboutsia lituseburensis]